MQVASAMLIPTFSVGAVLTSPNATIIPSRFYWVNSTAGQCS
jgi:hypothetical protein